MFFLEAEVDFLGDLVDVIDGGLDVGFGRASDEGSVDPNGSADVRDCVIVILDVTGSADGDFDDELHEFADGGVTHGCDAGFVNLAIVGEASVSASVSREPDLPEGACAVDGDTETRTTTKMLLVEGRMGEIHVLGGVAEYLLDELVLHLGPPDCTATILQPFVHTKRNNVTFCGIFEELLGRHESDVAVLNESFNIFVTQESNWKSVVGVVEGKEGVTLFLAVVENKITEIDQTISDVL